MIYYAKTKFPSSVKVSYAANWSEYHHDPNTGIYHLDPLWSVADFVGIDAYFPLTETHTLSYQEIYNGWESGEYYDYYYLPPDYNTQYNLSPRYAIKNIRYWWENEHYNPGNVRTSWIPESKEIWFTELGFASVNATAVQPNIFVDPTSSEGGYPRGSTQETSFAAQAVALDASLDYLSSQEWMGNIFVWTWDARPFPAFPFSNFWSDGGNWQKGHWLNGKDIPIISGRNATEVLEREYPEIVNPASLVSDPIDTSTGAQIIKKQLLHAMGIRPMIFEIAYNSLLVKDGPLGYGWSHPFEASLNIGDDGTIHLYWNANQFNIFEEVQSGKYVSADRKTRLETIELLPDGKYKLHRNNQDVYLFNANGKLIEQQNKYGQALKFFYDSQDRLVQIEEPISGVYFSITYNQDGQIIEVADNAGHEAAFAYDVAGNLTAITDPLNQVTTYDYNDNHQIVSAMDNENVMLFSNQFDEFGRIIKQQDALGNATLLAYSESYIPEKLTTIVSDRAGGLRLYVHNEKYELVQLIDELGNVTSYSYDLYGNRTKIVDPLNNETTVTYDVYGNVLQSEDAYGNSYFYTYDGRNNLLTITDPLNNVTEYEYNHKNRIVRRVDALHQVTSYEYDVNSNLVSITDPLNNETLFDYDIHGRLSKQTDAEGNETTFQYNSVGWLTHVTDPEGGTIEIVYDAAGNKIAVIDQEGEISHFTYNSHGDKLSYTDPRGNTTFYQYNGNGKLIREQLSVTQVVYYSYDEEDRLIEETNAEGLSTRYEYDPKGRLSRYVDVRGNATNYQYDELDRIVQVDAPGWGTASYVYDKVGRKIAQTDGEGNTESYVYDTLGRVIVVKDALNRETTLNYDAVGNIVSISDPLDREMLFYYDANGNLVEQQDENGNSTFYEYDKINRLIAETNALDHTTSYEYDGVGRLIAVSRPSGGQTKYGYDLAGRLLYVEDAYGKKFQYEYDANGNVIGIEDALGNRIIAREYNEQDLLAREMDVYGRSTDFFYDNLNRLITEVDRADRIREFLYDTIQGETVTVDPMLGITVQRVDEADRISTMVDPNGNETRFEYDNNGLLVGEYFGNANREYSYTPTGKLSSVTNARGQLRTFSYDDGDRLQTAVDAAGTINYTYDDADNLLKIVENNEEIEFDYNEINQIVSYKDTFGNVVSFTYDEDGNMSSIIYPGNKVVTYDYDLNGRLIKVTDWNNNETLYAYDDNGKLVRTDKPDGSSEIRAYFETGQLSRISIVNANGDVLYDTAYGYDEVGNLTEENNIVGGYPFVPVDAVSMSYGTDNRLTEINHQSVVFDADGNMIEGPLLGVTESFTYDVRNRLVEAGDISYAYDALNNRIAVESSANERRYVYNPIAPLSQLLMETDDQGTPIAYYVHGIGLISRETAGGEYAVYHYDRRGSTILLTDETGTVTDTYSYDVYGAQIGHVGNTDQPFGYNGKFGIMTDENGLLYMRARYYSPELRRFLNRDVLPGNVADGQSLNRYAYVNGNPVSFVDPFGLSRDSDDSHTFWTVAKDVGMGALNFLILDDARTLLSNESSLGEKAWAATSFIPAGKLLNIAGKGLLKLFGKATRFERKSGNLIECNCFTAGTKVMTDEGEKPIEEIEVGDKVLAKSEFDENGELAYKEVTALYTNYRNDIIKLYIGDLLIETTDNHPFWVEGRGWVFADELKAGDKLQKADGSNLTIDRVEFVLLDEPVMVYNFTVEEFHTYYVTDLGIWVHNTNCFSQFRNFDYHFEKHVLGKHGGKKEFGNITKEQYYEQAFNLSLKDADGKTIFRKALSNGRMATYNKNTNELVILHDGVEIGTYFKPSRGIDYFNDLK